MRRSLPHQRRCSDYLRPAQQYHLIQVRPRWPPSSRRQCQLLTFFSLFVSSNEMKQKVNSLALYLLCSRVIRHNCRPSHSFMKRAPPMRFPIFPRRRVTYRKSCAVPPLAATLAIMIVIKLLSGIPIRRPVSFNQR